MPVVRHFQRARARPLARVLALAALFSVPSLAAAQGAPATDSATPPSAWYERLSLRGYAQIRYNRLLETNPELRCEQCDRSIGRNGGFMIRRARLVLAGMVHPRMFVYIQPDLATEIGGQLHALQVRDLYADIFLNEGQDFRLRIGQSKVPWGWENLQSSSNRLALDRNDALNSAVPNERDLGLVGFWTPTAARERYTILSDSGLKGSGDYGVVAVGVMNGQTPNRAEANDGRHVFARLTYPFRLASGQFVELGVQAYHGRFVVPQRTSDVAGERQFPEERVAFTAVVYPQPFGIQAEWTTGRGPEFVPDERTIAVRALHGGYVQTMWRTALGGQPLIPYVRAHRYDGGKKHELDARRYRVRELEIGAEWLVFRALELTAAYVFGDRTTSDGLRADDRQHGSFLRLQAQVNY